MAKAWINKGLATALAVGMARKKVEAIGQEIVEEIKGSFSDTSPSAPGTPPAVITGFLRDSVGYHVVGGSIKGMPASSLSGAISILTIYASAPYAQFLEFGTRFMAARPFIRPIIEKWRKRLR